jgi:hypothetical protein
LRTKLPYHLLEHVLMQMRVCSDPRTQKNIVFSSNNFYHDG